MDHVGAEDKGEAGAPCSAVRPGDGDPRRGACGRRRQSARVPDAERKADIGIDAAQDALGPSDRGCTAWLSFVVPGLGGGEDGPSAGGHRGGAGSRRPEQGRGRLRAFGPDRAAAESHVRLGGVPRWRPWAGCSTIPVMSRFATMRDYAGEAQPVYFKSATAPSLGSFSCPSLAKYRSNATSSTVLPRRYTV